MSTYRYRAVTGEIDIAARTLTTGDFSTATISVTGNEPVVSQGLHLQWNRAGLGKGYIINQQGFGAGEIVIGKSTTADVFTALLTIDDSITTNATGLWAMTGQSALGPPTTQSVNIGNGTDGASYIQIVAAAAGPYSILDFSRTTVNHFRMLMDYNSTRMTMNFSATGKGLSLGPEDVAFNNGRFTVSGTSASAHPALQCVTAHNAVGGTSTLSVTSLDATKTATLQLGYAAFVNASTIVYNPVDDSLFLSAGKVVLKGQTTGTVLVTSPDNVGGSYGTNTPVSANGRVFRNGFVGLWDIGLKVTLPILKRGHYLVSYVGQALTVADGIYSFDIKINGVSMNGHVLDIRGILAGAGSGLVGSGCWPVDILDDVSNITLETTSGTGGAASYYQISATRIG